MEHDDDWIYLSASERAVWQGLRNAQATRALSAVEAAKIGRAMDCLSRPQSGRLGDQQGGVREA